MTVIRITQFSDILCVWAYVSQVRYDELQTRFPGQTSMEYHFVSVFGDVQAKLQRQWSKRGGLEGYAAHVQEIGARYEHIDLHPRVWIDATPASSMPAHLFLCAVRLLEEHEEVECGAVARLAWRLRSSFFEQSADITARGSLFSQAEASGLAPGPIENLLDNGRAHAGFQDDLAQAHARGVSMSPTLLLNEDRQRLAGNVGYRLIEANVRELLEDPAPGGSWC